MPSHIGRTLPELLQVPTRAFSSRNGVRPIFVVQHRWGGGSLPGVEDWFKNPADDASAHLVYAGETGKYAGKCAQMVKIEDKAWTQAAYNAHCISIESADAIWQGKDPEGFARLARITAFLCEHYKIPARSVSPPMIHNGAAGCCRHGDLGALGGGHPNCPTLSHAVWDEFVSIVVWEHRRGQFRKSWTN